MLTLFATFTLAFIRNTIVYIQPAKHIRQLFLVTALLISFALCVYAQLPYKYFQSSVYDKSKGLQVDENIEYMATDNKGFLWVSTTNGLFRFSEILFKGFPVKNNVPGTLPAYNIRFFVQDKKGNYWLNPLYKGIWNYNDSLGFFVPLKLKNDTIGISGYQLSSPYFDSKDFLWINLQGKGLMRINTADSTCKFYDLKDPEKGYDYRSTSWITCMAEYKKGYYWIATNNGLLLLNENTGIIQRKKSIHQQDGYEKALISVYIDKDSTLWLGSWGYGLQHYFPEEDKWENYFVFPSKKNNTENIVKDILPLSNDELLAGSSYGLLVFNKNTKQFYKCRDAFVQSGSAMMDNGNSTNDLTGWNFCTDNAGNLFATDFFNKIITRINLSQKAFSYTNLFPGNTYNTSAFSYSNIISGQRGNYILSSSWGRGLYLYNTETEVLQPVQVKPVQPFLNINDIFLSGDSLWLSTHNGLYVYSVSGNKFLNIPYILLTRELGGSEVLSFTTDNKTVWAATYKGVMKYDIKDNTTEWLNKENGKLPGNGCLRLYTDRAGNIWMGMQSTGLVCFIKNTGQIKWYGSNVSVGAGNVEDITQTNDGSILFACRGNGVYKINKPLTVQEKIILLTTDDGLASNRVYNMFTDSDGYTWFSTSNGLTVWNPYKKDYYNFYKEDGLLQDEISGRCSEIKKGFIAVPLKYGFVLVNRDNLPGSNNNQLLPIAIHRFTVNGKAFAHNIQYIHDITLAYTQNNLSIDFSAQCFDNTSAVQYKYRLLGLDTSWTFIYSRTNLSLFALPPGRYTLQLYAFNKNTHAAGKYYELNVSITPPFWKTWWFILLMVAIITGSLYILYHYRLHQALMLERMRSTISSDLHDEVGATLSSISIFSQTAKQLAQANPQRSAAILDRIGENSRQIVDSISDIVWSINPANDSFDKMLLRMRTYATELLEVKEMYINWQAPEDVHGLTLSMEQRKNFYLIFKEAVNNAAKYSKAKTLSVGISIRSSVIHLTIKDDGIGFDIHNNKKGNGLDTMQRRATLLKGSFILESQSKKGTSVLLSFPYK